MAVVLYRGDEVTRVQPQEMQNFFKRGWALNKAGDLPEGYDQPEAEEPGQPEGTAVETETPTEPAPVTETGAAETEPNTPETETPTPAD